MVKWTSIEMSAIFRNPPPLSTFYALVHLSTWQLHFRRLPSPYSVDVLYGWSLTRWYCVYADIWEACERKTVKPFLVIESRGTVVVICISSNVTSCGLTFHHYCHEQIADILKIINLQFCCLPIGWRICGRSAKNSVFDFHTANKPALIQSILRLCNFRMKPKLITEIQFHEIGLQLPTVTYRDIGPPLI